MVESIVGANLPDAAASANKFIALAVMFQSLTLAWLLVGVALIRGYVIGQKMSDSTISFVLVVVVIFVLAALMLWSYRRYKSLWSQATCMSFVALVTSESRSTN